MRAVIEECRRRFGQAPRSFGFWNYLTYIKARRPPWMLKSPDDWLNEPFNRQGKIWREGVIVWGALVQANRLLFEPGPDDCPASILISPHGSFDEDVKPLQSLAKNLYDLKGEGSDDPVLAEFSRVLEDELDRAPGLQVPTRFTAGRPVFHTPIMIIRKHLPNGRLGSGFFPVVVDPSDFKAAMVLPSKYWAIDMLESWS